VDGKERKDGKEGKGAAEGGAVGRVEGEVIAVNAFYSRRYYSLLLSSTLFYSLLFTSVLLFSTPPALTGSSASTVSRESATVAATEGCCEDKRKGDGHIRS
jgi:hypothetical protein